MQVNICALARRLGWAAVAAALSWGTGAMAQRLVLPVSSIVPAARIQVNLGSDNNHNTTVDLTAQHLASPDRLQPPQQVYVVWIEPPGEAPQREGLLSVDSGLSGELKFTTPLRQFTVLITAEDNAQSTSPGGIEIARGAVARAVR